MVSEQITGDMSAAGENFYGVIKSYNERRGFGFVACEETARRFGRDVYLAKEEAVILAQEPIVGLSSAPGVDASSGQPLIKEGDFLQFQVQRSTEGYPQAVRARRMRRLRGSVTRAIGPSDSEGAIIVNGGDSATAEAEESLKQLVGKEVRVRQRDCGQLWLAVDDDVAFVCADASSDGGPQVLEAQLVELLRTRRGKCDLLGCFTLELPRMLEGWEGEADTRFAELDGHALADRVVLSGIPPDLEVPELMRLFTKIGAMSAQIVHPDDSGSAAGFASISFSGPTDIARLLVRAAHTINEQGSTTLARLGPCRRRGATNGDSAAATLPALPRPSLTEADGGSLLVRWSQIDLATGYFVEVRACGYGDESAPWIPVHNEVDGADSLSSQLAGCRVNSVIPAVPYQARVTYFAASGCRSQHSPPSAPCALTARSSPQEPPALASPLPPRSPPPEPPLAASPPTNYRQPPATVTGASSFDFQMLHPLDPPPPLAVAPSPPRSPPPETPCALDFPHLLYSSPEVAGFAGNRHAQTLATASMELLTSPEILSQVSCLPPPPSHIATSSNEAPAPGWRCKHGGLVPAPPAPELIPFEEGGCCILIQWPLVVHAKAYSVELFEEGTAAVERFHRTVPDNVIEPLVELRVVNLQPGSYGACVRCIAPCGCESVPSSWSFLPPAAWLQASQFCVPCPVGAASVQTVAHSSSSQPQPAYLQPPTTLLSTSPGLSTTTGRSGTAQMSTASGSSALASPSPPPPPPPAEPPAVTVAGAPGAPPAAPPAAPRQAATKADALVLD